MIGENWLKVALTAMALGVGLYIIPLAMIANPTMIALSSTPIAALWAAGKTGIGLAFISYGLIGYTKPTARVSAIAVGLVIIFLDLSILQLG